MKIKVNEILKPEDKDYLSLSWVAQKSEVHFYSPKRWTFRRRLPKWISSALSEGKYVLVNEIEVHEEEQYFTVRGKAEAPIERVEEIHFLHRLTERRNENDEFVFVEIVEKITRIGKYAFGKLLDVRSEEIEVSSGIMPKKSFEKNEIGEWYDVPHGTITYY